MQQVLQQHLNRARHIMKVQADKNRTERTFQPGDSVFVKLQPYVQSSVEKRANHKLSFRYFGPFQVLQAINPVEYKLALPEGSKVHLVFHVSQLRRALTPGTTASPALPQPTETVLTPVEVMSNRWRQTPTGRREQLLVRWSDPAILDATWEDAVRLKERFPSLPAWGQAVSQGGGDVSSPSQDTETAGRNAAMAAKGRTAAMAAKRSRTRSTAMAANSPATAADDAARTNQGEVRVTAMPPRIIQPNRRYVGPEWSNGT